MVERISVILPSYNVQEYIHKCLNSIVNNTYKNIEIIIVNDGSTDNTLDVCCEFFNIEKTNWIEFLFEDRLIS